MDYRWSCPSVAVLSVMITACAEPPDANLVTVTDSAAVEIVTNHRAFTDVPSRSVPEEPARQITDDALYRVTALQPLPDGRIAVGTNGGAWVSIYDAAGVAVARMGREGDGPGEFRFIESLVVLPGDSLGVYDPQPERLTVFPLMGGDPRVLSLVDVTPALAWSRVHLLQDGLVYVGRAGLAGPAAEIGVYRNPAPSYRIDLEGRTLAAYGEFPGMQAFMGARMRSRALFGALLYTTTTGDRLVVGTGEYPELRIYGPDGALTQIVRWEGGDRTVTDEMKENYVEFMISQVPPDQSGATRDRLSEMLVAPELPTHAEVIASPSGAIWVGQYPGPEAEMPSGRRLSSRSWLVFGSDGTMRERIQTPPGFLPMALADDVVWGVYYDELGVESIRAYGASQ